MISSDLLQAVITDLLFPVFNRIDQGRLSRITARNITDLLQAVDFTELAQAVNIK